MFELKFSKRISGFLYTVIVSTEVVHESEVNKKGVQMATMNTLEKNITSSL